MMKRKLTDKQLRGLQFQAVLRKRRLGQALNAKEFAVVAGFSYSTARAWFRLPGFPRVRGVVFWEDFVHWRRVLAGLREASAATPGGGPRAWSSSDRRSNFGGRAAQILAQAG
jgi:hypothetical protein